MPKTPVQNHVRDDDSIIVEVEAEANLEDDTEPLGPRCKLEWVGDHAEVHCESEDDMALAKALLTSKPLKLKLRADDDGAQDPTDKDTDQ